MHVTIRPYATTGVALVGAAVIAVTPIAPPPSEIAKPVSDAAVRLAAAPNPLDFYGAILNRTVANTGELVDNYLQAPLPITRKIIANQIAADVAIGVALADAVDGFITQLTTTVPFLLGQAIDDLIMLNVAGAVNNTLLAALALLEPLQAPIGVIVDARVQPLRNLVAAIDAVISDPAVNLETLLLAAVGPALAGIQGAADATQNIIDAVVGLDPVGLAFAVVDFPGYVVDGVLNGGYFNVLGLPVPGLLNPGFVSGDPATPLPGLVNWFIEASQHIADALEPCCTTMMAVNEAPDPNVELVAFSLDEGTDEGNQPLAGESEDGQGDEQQPGDDAGADEETDTSDVDADDETGEDAGEENEEAGEEGESANPGTMEVRDSLNFSPDATDPDAESGTDSDGDDAAPDDVDADGEGAGDAGDQGSEGGGEE